MEEPLGLKCFISKFSGLEFFARRNETFARLGHATPLRRLNSQCLDPNGDLEDPHGTGAQVFQEFADRLRRSIHIRLAEIGLAEEALITGVKIKK